MANESKQFEATGFTFIYSDPPPQQFHASQVSIIQTAEEIILDFAEVLVERADGSGLIPALVRSRIVLTPQHAARFVAALATILVGGGQLVLPVEAPVADAPPKESP